MGFKKNKLDCTVHALIRNVSTENPLCLILYLYYVCTVYVWLRFRIYYTYTHNNNTQTTYINYVFATTEYRGCTWGRVFCVFACVCVCGLWTELFYEFPAGCRHHEQNTERDRNTEIERERESGSHNCKYTHTNINIHILTINLI